MSQGEVTRYVDVIVRMLAVQLDGHDRLLAAIAEKRQAVRIADLDEIGRICRVEQAVVRKLGDLERNRRQVSEQLAKELGHAPERPLTVEAIAVRTDPGRAERLRALAGRLRERVLQVREESAVVTEAAHALSRHLAGLIQTVQRTINRTGVYERAGKVASGQTDFCVDVRS